MFTPVKSLLFSVLLAFSACLSSGVLAEVRTWNSGSYTLKGEFIELLSDGQTVRVKANDGSVVRMKVKRLSSADKDYIRQQTKNTSSSVLSGIPVENRYALLIGVNDYSNEPLLGNLPSPGKDMTDLRDALIKHFKFKSDNIILLIDKNASSGQPTRANIQSAVDKLIQTIPEKSILFVAFSGHGVMIDMGNTKPKSYLCVKDTSFSGETAEDVLKTIIDRDVLFAQVDRCRAKQKIFFSDACRNKMSADTIRQMASRSAKGMTIVGNSDDESIQNWKYNYVLFSSCAPEEKSIDAVTNGLFMKHLLDGLNSRKAVRQDGKLTIFSWFEYAADKTIQDSKKIIATGGVRPAPGQTQQTPKIRCPEEMGMVVLGRFEPLKDPNDVIIKKYNIGTLKVTLKPMNPFEISGGGSVGGKFDLPPLPTRIPELEGINQGIAEAIREMKAGTHEALSEVAQTIREAENQYSVLDKRCLLEWKDLPYDVQSDLKKQISAQPHSRPTLFRSLKPEKMGTSDFIKLVLWGQKAEQARLEMEKVKREVKEKITLEIEKMEAERRDNLTRLEEEKTNFRKQVLLTCLSHCKGYDTLNGQIDYDLMSDAIPVILGYKLNWTEDSLWDEAEKLWRSERPCVKKEREKIKQGGSSAGERLLKTVKGVDFAFRWCPAGRFMMGSSKGEAGRNDDEGQHKVTLSHGFWMLETEVTQQQWQAVMGNNPSNFKGDNLPVEQVSWNDCQDFCKKFYLESGLQIGLPTEAQWEYACRGGTTMSYNFDTLLNGDEANCDGNYPCGTTMSGKYLAKTTPVGSYSANAWGLSDMHGNVWEWCSDWYGDYPSGSVTDPTGATSGTIRVYRGGGWGSGARNCRSAYRDRDSPDYRYHALGFRPVIVLFVP